MICIFSSKYHTPDADVYIIYAELRARVPRPRHPPQRQDHWRDVRGWHRPAAGQQHRRLATPQHVRAHPKPHKTGDGAGLAGP